MKPSNDLVNPVKPRVELLNVGDVFELVEGMTVMSKVPNHLLYSNRIGDWTLSSGSVTPHSSNVFKYLLGNYVVTKITQDGGSSGRTADDTYPDGHHVWAQNVEHQLVEINFYQTGCFINMHRDVPVIGKAMAQTWNWERYEN